MHEVLLLYSPVGVNPVRHEVYISFKNLNLMVECPHTTNTPSMSTNVPNLITEAVGGSLGEVTSLWSLPLPVCCSVLI